MSDQSSSDPLPFVRLDRAGRQKAAPVASLIGTTYQHALGSLVEWWETCGDPRELERIIEQTPAGETPQVVLTEQEAMARFRAASGGKVAEAIDFVTLGLLEPKGEGRVRVRGMSRYFEPVLERMHARSAAVRAGKASAEARRNKYGTAQPRSVEQALEQTNTRSNGVRTPPNGHAERPPESARTPPNPADSVQRSAVNGLEATDLSPDGDARTPGGLLQKLWNELTKPPLPKCRELNKDRRTHAKARWSEHPSEGYWRQVIARIAASEFCRGGGRDSWVADFDFLLSPSTGTKALEGKYDDRGRSGANATAYSGGSLYEP